MYTVHHRFQEVTRSQRVNVKCAGCGKPRVRTVSVTNTINPFNRNELGHVRSPQEVLDCVRAELANQVRITEGKQIICKTCLAKDDAAKAVQAKP